MTDQKKHTLEADLREVAGWLSLHGPAHAPLRDRLLKWADGKDPNEQPFNFQRSYDRGVRRFELRHGGITYELHWFKGGGVPFPVRDAYGNQWTASGVHHSTSSNDLIAEAPADVQLEDQGDA